MLYLLLALSDGARHGYAIKQEAEARSDGRVRLGPGTLYAAIQRLLDAGLAREVPGASEPANGQAAQRRYYELTPRGRTAAARRGGRSGPPGRIRPHQAPARVMRVYRLLLRVYPAWFRQRFESEIVEAFAEERRLARASGRSPLRFWIHTLADLVVSARAVRRGRRRTRPHSTRHVMEALRLDLGHALAQLIRRPGFSIAAVLSLALGIGGNAALFAFADGFVFHPFAYPEPDRRRHHRLDLPAGVGRGALHRGDLGARVHGHPERAYSLTSLAVFDLGNRNISGGDRAERVFTALAFTDLFAPFGLRPLLGRGFSADELAPGGPAVAVLSYRVWQGRFGGDTSIVGRTIRVNGTPTTVIGVMPAELLILGSDLWIPWGGEVSSMPRNFRPLTLIGRLAPGSTLEQANSELGTIAAATTAAHAVGFEEYQGWRVAAVPWTTALMRDIRSGMLLMLGAVALVLLIACANLSSLALARSATRQREMAICLALGAGRWGLARQQLAEVVWLALAGGGLGLLVAYAGLPALVSLVPRDANTLGLAPQIGWRVVLWAGALTVGSAIVVALLPVYQATRTSSHDALKAEGRSLTASRGTLRLRHGLIVGEIALAVVLLAGAGLFVRSFVNLQRVPLGFDADQVLTMRLTLPAERYRGPAINDFFQRLLDTLDSTPGVRAASVATQLPLQSRLTTPFRIDGVDAPADTLPTALITVVGGPHFTTLRTPMMEGRVDRRAGSRRHATRRRGQRRVRLAVPARASHRSVAASCSVPAIGQRRRWRSSASSPTRRTSICAARRRRRCSCPFTSKR